MRRVDFDLRELSIFSDLSEEDIKFFKDELFVNKYRRNDFLFKPKDVADNMYIIVEGKLKVFTINSMGNEQMLYILKKNDFIGGLNLLKRTEYIYYGQAIENMKIIKLSRSVFDKIVYRFPKVTTKILEQSFVRIRLAEDLITRLVENHAEIKVANLLISLADSFGTKEGNNITIQLNINRENLGSFAGLTRETLTRKFSEFRDMGILEFEGNRKIIIKSIEALKNVGI